MRIFGGSPPTLGPLELTVMEVVWARGESSVHGVLEALERPLKYTTVMTTLDRLYKKGLLKRRKQDRAFFYTARLSRQEWEHKLTGDWVASLLAGPRATTDLLISHFVDAVGRRDRLLLDRLESRIRTKREELERGSGGGGGGGVRP